MAASQQQGEVCPFCGEGTLMQTSHSSCGVCDNCFESPCNA